MAPTLFDSLLAGIFDHLWQSTVTGILILGLIAFCRRCPAHVRRALSGLGLIKFLIPSLVFLPVLGRLSQLASRWRVHADLSLPASFSPSGYIAHSGATSTFVARCLMGLVVLSAVVSMGLLAGWILRGRWARRRILANAAGLPLELSQALASASEKMGLSVPLARAVSADQSPGLIGLLNPIVLVPSYLDRTLSPRELEAVLMHELVHLKRRDNAWCAVQSAILCLFWFNPVVILLCRSFRLETEKSCDEAVVERLRDANAYADAILKLVQATTGLSAPFFSGVTQPPIASRIKNILNPRSRSEHPAMKFISLLLACLLIVLSSALRSSAQDTSAAGVSPYLGQIYDLNQLDQKPKATTQPRPQYPFEMRRAGVTGSVLVDFIVKPDGTVVDAHAVSSTKREFEGAAVAAVSKWQFKPGRRAGSDVPTHMQVNIMFDLGKGK